MFFVCSVYSSLPKNPWFVAIWQVTELHRVPFDVRCPSKSVSRPFPTMITLVIQAKTG